MAETANIARAAEKVFKDIFEQFGWERTGSTNVNFGCTTQEHKKQTHPTDVVTGYKNPYSGISQYLNIDLKSYAAGSITKTAIQDAIDSLAKTIACARVSSEWQQKFVTTGQWRVDGLLFVYNHDGEYDKEFTKVLLGMTGASASIPANVRIFTVSPADVAYLATVAVDMRLARADGLMRPLADDPFFSPHLVRVHAGSLHSSVATIEALLGPWLIVRKPDIKPGYIIYSRMTGESEDEFTYLIDYLFRLQLLTQGVDIQLRLPFGGEAAFGSLSRAVNRFALTQVNGDAIKALLDQISIVTVTNIVQRFLAFELGLDRND